MSEAQVKEQLTLATKIAMISGDIDKIAKTGKNRDQGYLYIEYATVAGKIRELCSKYRIAIVPQVDSFERTEVKSKNGTVGFHYILNMTFSLINGDKPDERENRAWVSEGIDYGDKGINKSITAAEKYFLMRLFHISERDSEDADMTTPQAISKTILRVDKPTEKQLGFLKKLLKEAGKTDKEAEKIASMCKTAGMASVWIEKAKSLPATEEVLPSDEEV